MNENIFHQRHLFSVFVKRFDFREQRRQPFLIIRSYVVKEFLLKTLRWAGFQL